jgi:hypothetical protein
MSVGETQSLTLEVWIKIPIQPLGLLFGWKAAQGMTSSIGALKAHWVHEEF